jgi:hypothetical protein
MGILHSLVDGRVKPVETGHRYKVQKLTNVSCKRSHLLRGVSRMTSKIELSARGTKEPSPVADGIWKGSPAKDRA